MKKFLLFISFFVIIPHMYAGNRNTSADSLIVLDYPASLDELLLPFRGKVVYLDVLASWCKPCIAELEASRKFDSFFEQNSIVKIYITIDQLKDIDKCIVLLNKYDAKGYFIHYALPEDVSSAFPSEIEQLFLKDENGNYSISIPRYAIVGKNGEIKEKRAKRPSSGDELIHQLKKYLLE